MTAETKPTAVERVNFHGMTSVRPNPEGKYVLYSDHVARVEALEALAHCPETDMVQVRELEWKGHGDRLEASALGLQVFYRVEGSPGNWALISPGKTQYVRTPGYETQAAAKNAAQVDFSRRIRLELR